MIITDGAPFMVFSTATKVARRHGLVWIRVEILVSRAVVGLKILSMTVIDLTEHKNTPTGLRFQC